MNTPSEIDYFLDDDFDVTNVDDEDDDDLVTRMQVVSFGLRTFLNQPLKPERNSCAPENHTPFSSRRRRRQWHLFRQ